MREVRTWICDDSSCTCGGEIYVMSYQDIVDVGLPICTEGTEMVQLSGVGYDPDSASNALDREIESYKIINSYYGGECPDCSEGIPNDIHHGQACYNCGHIFVLPEEAL